MPVQQDTLRPGLLVSLKTTLQGNISYSKRVLESEHVVPETGVEQAKWETVRTITDRVEHDKGRKAQAEARSLVTRVCTNTAFGLLCPEADKENLERALVEARKIADIFNREAQLSRLTVYVITGRVAPDDVEAIKAISAEVRKLMETMEEGVKNCDAEVIRSAANEANRLGTMLAPEAAGRVKVAIDAARTAARRIVKAGEQAAQEVDLATVRRLEEVRLSFLDLDGEQGVEVSEAEGRAFDLTPDGNSRIVVKDGEFVAVPLDTQLDLEEAIEEKTGA